MPAPTAACRLTRRCLTGWLVCGVGALATGPGVVQTQQRAATPRPAASTPVKVQAGRPDHPAPAPVAGR